MSYEEGDCFQSGVDGGIFRSQIEWRGADRRWGFGASCGLKVRKETGRLSPPQSVIAFRLSSMLIGRYVPDYI